MTIPDNPTVQVYLEHWIERRRRERARAGTLRAYRHHLCAYISPTLGARRVADLTPRDAMQLRSELLGRLSPRSARTVFATFRAAMREATYPDELLTRPLFDGLPRWPRTVTSAPDPFDAVERERIIAYFEPTPHGRVVATLLLVGLRPSEAAALSWSDVADGYLSIRASRVCGETNAPKTARSRRTIRLTTFARAIIGSRPSTAIADDVFPGFNQEIFGKRDWPRALRELGLRHRKLYACRHTFISIALSSGCNIKFLAEYCGTSVQQIEQAYARFIGQPELELERLEKCSPRHLRAAGSTVA
jgi:integrase